VKRSLIPILICAKAFVLLAGLCLWGTVSNVSVAEDAKSAKGVVLNGDEGCTRCHDETSDFPVFAIGKTKHGTMADGRTPSCTSCHGPSETHMNPPEGSKGRPKPTNLFGKNSTTPIADRNGACLTCHSGDQQRMHWQTGPHAAADLACTSCHQVHTSHDAVREKTTQADVCFTCHKPIRNMVSRTSHHPIVEGLMSCSDCHNPHGTAGEKMMVRDNVNDTCYQCHMEKRGPFIRTHQPVQENCSICHNPHGTTLPNMLRERAPFLCQSCHEPTSHRGNMASTSRTGFGSDQNTIARGCLNCHTNIHGTNNPADISNERTLRR